MAFWGARFDGHPVRVLWHICIVMDDRNMTTNSTSAAATEHVKQRPQTQYLPRVVQGELLVFEAGQRAQNGPAPSKEGILGIKLIVISRSNIEFLVLCYCHVDSVVHVHLYIWKDLRTAMDKKSEKKQNL